MNRLPHPPHHSTGVADVYVDSRSRVWLLDINPFSAVTDSLLFDWSEDALAAPLPPPPTPLADEETLPPDVFMRIHLDPSAPLGAANGAGLPQAENQAPAENGSSVVPQQLEQVSGGMAEGRSGEEPPRSILAGATGFTLVGGEGADFELRCVPSSLHMVPDPMGRYRGPADVGMGTLMCGTGGDGGLELEDLIESCRLAANEN